MKNLMMRGDSLRFARRAVLASGPALIALASCQGSPALASMRKSGEFDAAHAAYQTALAAFLRDDNDLTDHTSQNLANDVDAAFSRLLQTPSRDSADLAAKLEAYLVEYEDCMMDEDRLRLIASDARRLASVEARHA